MTERGLMIFFIFSSLIFTASGFIADIIKNFFNGVHIDYIDLGKDVGSVSNLELMFNNSYLNVKDKGLFGFSLYVIAPEIKLIGEYDFIHLDLPGLFPLRGKGIIDARLKETIIEIEGKTNIDMQLIYEFKTFNISTNSSKVIFENLFDDPDITKFINSIVSELLPSALKILSDVHSHYLEPILHHFIVEFLNCMIFHQWELDKCLEDIRFPDYSMIEPLFHEKDIVYSTKSKKKIDLINFKI